jgi:hypothetical protein
MQFEARGRRVALVVFALCGVALSTARVHAYGDLFRFNDLTNVGGGGGRWFTSSIAEGYGCQVCHEGGQPVAKVVVAGLPPRYQPGATYDLTVSWPATEAHGTALVELTDQRGVGAGISSVPSENLSPAETCVPTEQGIPAGIVLGAPDLKIADQRQIIGAQDCGAHALHFRWTAPSEDVGPISLAGGVIAADGNKDSAGDRFTRLFHTIASPSQAVEAMPVQGACAVAARPRRGGTGGGATTALSIALCLSVLTLAARLRRRQRARSLRSRHSY